MQNKNNNKGETSKEIEINKKQNEEMNHFKKKSAQKEIDLTQNLNKEEKQLLAKQNKELDDLIKNFDIKIKPKISSYFLQLKTREYFLCKLERYIEADETKKKAQEIYLDDNKYIDDEKKLKLYQKIEELNSKHRIEYMKFIKNKDKKVYYLKKEEDDEKKIINDKYNKQKQSELMKKNIDYFTQLNNEKKKKNNNAIKENYKRNKGNPWSQ